MSGRGFESRITTDNDMMFGDSSCVSCGACAHTCPTDAISDVFQSKSAAVDKKVRTTCSYCGVGCNLEASKLQPTPQYEHVVLTFLSTAADFD